LIPENFAKGPAHFFDGAPENIRDALREDVRGRVADTMRIAGLARHTPEEITELGVRSLSALSMLLGWKPYLMGERPSGVDATAFAALAGLLTPFFDSPLRDRALEFANLVAYVERMMAQYYPEHPWQRVAAAA
jgi:glutathione S-transferase